MGLLDQLTYDPQMALGMGLLGASGPSRMPVSLGQGLASAWGNMQEVAKEKQRADLMALQAKQADLGVQKGTLEMQQLLRQQEALKRIAEKFANPQSGQTQSAPYGGGYSPSVAAAFGVPAGSPQATQTQPDAKHNQFQRYMAMADAFDAEQLPELANKYRENALKLMPKYKTDNGFAINPANGKLEMWSTNDQSGKPEFVGVAPKPDISIEDLGGKKLVIDRNNIKPGTDFTKTMTPGEVASNGLGWFNAQKPEYNADLNGFITRPTKGNAPTFTPVALPNGMLNKGQREDLDSLRKEFDNQQPVKDYKAVAPIYNSVMKAPNTRAGDLDMVYGVGKILDPGSVVREGELVMVTNAASPANQIQGYINSLKGGGKLSPAQRKELTDMLGNRVGEVKNSYQAVRGTFEGIAKNRGYDSSQIFSGIPDVSISANGKGSAVSGGGWSATKINGG